MARYEISHPELPQLGGILELPDGEQPNERHFWEAAKTQVRPYGASQLSDKARITAMRNGFFDSPDIPIRDVEDDPDTIQDEAQPGLLTGLADMGKDFLIKTNPLTSPYSKVLQLDDEPINYKNDLMARQMRDAGKRLFGLLDNTEGLSELGFDPIDEALKQVGLPRGMRKEAGYRGMAKAAAMDYATGNVEASVAMGAVRAGKTAEFVAQGARHLTNWALLDEMDDDDALAFANSAIAFDKVNYEHEHAAQLAAWTLENPTDALLAATAGVAPKEMSFDSELEQDVRSGYQEPSEGMGLFTEVVADPFNLAGAWSAKAVTSPFRVGLKGKILKTLGEVQSKTLELTKLDTALKALPEDALVRGRIAERATKISEELVEQKKILDKFGDRSLLLRLAGKSSPETLGKLATETFDQSTDAGRLGMSMVIDATKATDDMGKLRKAAHLAAKVNPEITGATVGGMIAGPAGAVAGAALPSVIKVGRFLSALPENVAIRYIITGAQNAGEEITEQAARQRYRTLKSRAGYGLVGASAIGFSVDQDMLGGSAGVAAITALIGPKALSMMDNFTRDARVIGSELILAQTTEPFFRRVAALPTPEQGLAGATRDRFNLMTQAGPEGLLGRAADAIAQGSKAAVKEVAPDKLPFRVDRAGNAIGEAPFISPTAKKMANFLDKSGRFGRLGTPIEALGRFGKGMAAGASIPATLGFVASAGQPSGALAGAIMSAPFTALGAGAGMYETFKTKGDLYAKQIGDVQYYREHLGKRERAEFDSLPAHIRSMIAGYSLSHPDVVFKQTKKGGGNFDPQTMEVSYNPDAGGFLQGTMAHEITHFVELHGLMPMVNRILFGDKETKTAGEFASYDKDGNVVYSKEFQELREIYLDRMRKDPSIDPENVVEYEANPQKIAREIFADLGADYLLTGKRGKALNTGPLGKLVGATIDGITGVGFVRDFLLKLNMPLNAEGKFVTSTDLFKGKLKKIPEIERLLDKYYKDVRALRKSQIEGEEFTDPATGKKRETEGARPLDDEFDTLYSVEDQRNPNVVDKLDTGGLYKKNPKTGKVEKDAMGRPVGMTKKELEKVDNSAGDHAAKVFEENGIEITVDEKTGRSFSEDVGPLNEKIIDELARGPWHPRQIATLREISRALQAGDGERAGLLLGYFSATAGRKPKAVPFKMRQAFPFGLRLERQGNINVLLHDVDQLHKNLKFLKGETKGLPPELRGMYDKLFGAGNKGLPVWDAFHQYRDNMNAGINGRTGLDLDPVIADKKLNFLNALHGGLDKAHVEKNPVLRAIGSQMAMSNLKRNPFGVALRTFRLDRIFSAERSGTGSGFNYERAKTLASPEGRKLFSPQMELDFSPPKQATEAKPNFWKIYRIDPKGPKVYDEVADVLIQAGSPWMDGSIAESQAGLLKLDQNKLLQAMDRAHRRWERGDGKQFMPAAYHGTPHTFKPEEGAPLGKFKSAQIGTGEGAQAYGHGLYFAGKREVAEHYRKVLSDGKISDFVKAYKDKLSKAGKTIEDGVAQLEQNGMSVEARALKASPKELEQLNKGSLYKVELAPKENEYLYWDKALKDQPKGVKEKLEKMGESDPERMRFFKATILEEYTTAKGNAVKPGSHTGEDIYRALAGRGNPSESQWQGASAALKEAGIPGIKYLDGSSRAKGKGDFNYVLFDEADVTVTEKLFMPASEAGASKGNVKTKSDPAPLGKLSATFFQWDAIAELQKEGRTVRDAIPGKNRTVIAKVERGGGVTDDVIIKPDGTFDAGEGNILFMPSPGDTTPSSVKSWDGPNPTFATKLTKGMAKDNKEIAALLREVYEETFGEPLRAQNFSDTEVTWLADMLATEGEAALSRTGNAVDWYTSAVERALSVAEEIFPDIGKKFEAKDRFLGALSITSQNMKVLDNAKASVMQYEHKLRTGKFNYKVKHGEKGKAITQNLKMYDQIEAKMGIDAFHKFLDRDFTVKTLSEWGKKFFNNKKFSIAGYQTDKVKGSAVFGPKIGQGFFQNLRGNYDPVTVDLWLRRTYGRLTGLALDTALTPKDIGKVVYSVRKNVGKRKFAGLELPDFLQGVRITGNLQKDGKANFRISDKSFESLFGDNTIGRDNTEAIFEFAEKLNREWERNFAKAGNDVKKAKDAIRKAKKAGKGVVNLEKKLAKLEVEKEAIGNEKPQWAKAGSTITDKLKPIDVPSNAERAVITKAFNEALEQLRAKGIDLTPADLQATLWYPEKDIWAYLKGRDSNALNMSYDTAMEMIRDQRK